MNETGCMGDFKSGEDYKLNASGVFRARLLALDYNLIPVVDLTAQSH